MITSQKTWLAITFCSLVFCFRVQAERENLSVYLRAIARIETGDNPTKIGPNGERTRWQIRRVEWEQCSRVPFTRADDVEGQRVATQLLLSRIQNFEKRYAQAPTPGQVYLLWHRPARARAPRALEKERAKRFSNLFALEITRRASTEFREAIAMNNGTEPVPVR